MKILIIEDETHARNELERLLAKTGMVFEVLSCIDTIEDSVIWLKSNPAPDLIFLDIQLADGLSFEIFKQVDIRVPVIFTTAYDEYALKAFRLNSIDYLLKPVRLEDLKQALIKLEDVRSHYKVGRENVDMAKINKLLDHFRQEYKTRFIANIGDQIRYIDVKEIAYFMAEDNEVMLVTRDSKRYFVDYSLESLVGELDPKDFFRLTRSYIANISAIGKISKYFNSRLLVELLPPAEDKILVSRVKAPEFLNWLGK